MEIEKAEKMENKADSMAPKSEIKDPMEETKWKRKKEGRQKDGPIFTHEDGKQEKIIFPFLSNLLNKKKSGFPVTSGKQYEGTLWIRFISSG